MTKNKKIMVRKEVSRRFRLNNQDCVSKLADDLRGMQSSAAEEFGEGVELMYDIDTVYDDTCVNFYVKVLETDAEFKIRSKAVEEQSAYMKAFKLKQYKTLQKELGL